MKVNISFIECYWQRMQGAERRRAGFCFPLMDQVVLLFFCIYVNCYHVMFTVLDCCIFYEDIIDLHGLLLYVCPK